MYGAKLQVVTARRFVLFMSQGGTPVRLGLNAVCAQPTMANFSISIQSLMRGLTAVDGYICGKDFMVNTGASAATANMDGRPKCLRLPITTPTTYAAWHLSCEQRLTLSACCHEFFAQIYGHKRFFLMPPDRSLCTYPRITRRTDRFRWTLQVLRDASLESDFRACSPLNTINGKSSDTLYLAVN